MIFGFQSKQEDLVQTTARRPKSPPKVPETINSIRYNGEGHRRWPCGLHCTRHGLSRQINHFRILITLSNYKDCLIFLLPLWFCYGLRFETEIESCKIVVPRKRISSPSVALEWPVVMSETRLIVVIVFTIQILLLTFKGLNI